MWDRVDESHGMKAAWVTRDDRKRDTQNQIPEFERQAGMKEKS